MIPQEIAITSGRQPLRASLCLPDAPRGLILLPQTGGIHPGCRHEFAARIQEEHGFATLLLNLVSFRDAQGSDLYGNVPLLTQRILDALAWLHQESLTAALPCGILAAGSAVPAALRAAAQRDAQVQALVCRGGLPDQAGAFYLETLLCPTLLLFGADDPQGQASGLRCQDKTHRHCKLQIIPDADREFSAPPHFETAARIAGQWLLAHVGQTAPGPESMRLAVPGT
ncbi:MAG: hypothetical protein LWW84_16600 [Azovibrio sp.]|nr:hypothetical protein [Azovibrio sp.]